LWLYLSWLPLFFLHNYQLNLTDSALFSFGVFLAGVIGDTFGGVLSDNLFRRSGEVTKARRNVIVTGFLGCCLFWLPILFIHQLVIIATCLSMAFFFADMIVGPIWAVPMDIAPRYAGTASGLMNIGFGFAGIISPVVFGLLIDRTGRWDVPFIFSHRAASGAMLSFFIRPDRAFEGGEARQATPVETPRCQ
jgi:MFS family permease